MFNIALNEGTSCHLLQVCIPLLTDHILMIIVTGFLMRSKLWFSSSLRVDVFRWLVSQNRHSNGELRLQ